MKWTAISLILAAFAGLAGCSTTSVQSDSGSSEALNLARAANFDNDLEDKKVPADTVADFRQSAVFGTAYVASGYNTPVPGLSAGASAGMNLLSWAIAPTSPSARNNIFGWYPAGEYKSVDFRDRFIANLETTVPPILQMMGYELIITKGQNSNVKVVTFEMVNESKGCPKAMCRLAFLIAEPETIDAGDSYMCTDPNGCLFLNAGKTVHSYYRFFYNGKGENPLKELAILTAVSEASSEKTYFYVAPKKVQVDGETKVNVPAILHKGKLNFFVVPSA